TPPETYRRMWQHLEQGRPWHGELLNRRKSGELFWDDTAIAPITDETGKVINFVAFKEDITQRKAREEEVWQQANFDSLTGLPNRSHFLHQLKRKMAESIRYHHKLALLFIDLDGFKQVNDTLGHDAGDELLELSARRLTGAVRETDLVARLGGDEFTVIVPQFGDCGDIDLVAHKLIDALSRPYEVKGERVHVSASMGIAAYPYDAEDETSLINMADTAMYSAKRRGKNRYVYYADTPEEDRLQMGLEKS
ncbi:MAG: diguanylate cyclase domain-containing protein, partial [Pseudomonadota bacterium]